MKTQQILLARRPQGAPVPEDFRFVETELPEPEYGEVIVAHRFLSLDPYQRGRMDDAKSYSAPVALGAVMECQAVGQVAASRDGRFQEGDWVLGGFGWQSHSVRPAHALIPIDPTEASPSTALGVLGMPGLTAWVGLEDIGQPKAGEMLVVSAASGAVGQVVGQLGRIRGAKVVGIAGGAAKCAYVKDTLGFDAAIDHRGDLDAQLDAACPGGIDVYWENVGGAVQAAVFPRLNEFGRMVMCGVIAQYNTASGLAAHGAPPGPNLGPVVRKRLRIQGFIVSDNGWKRYGQFRAEMLDHIKAGRMQYREDVAMGLANAPAAFIGMLEGRNFGKQVVALD
ncbi:MULTISPECIES: NADP-dependent oxidoreductase [Roseomonadaceae]|uniref:NADP-dependent oxidoreductase n=1 Tax=Falsiroseomonas oleicola TaxID=2801474 RepID=A0ABS6H5I5_9PROT|nr:NADP-dependent oxidoreductase [Roseomonas oleicola]MBU8543102.1 NADP-dependent oxidoreductase [Roseomonas oleicola]